MANGSHNVTQTEKTYEKSQWVMTMFPPVISQNLTGKIPPLPMEVPPWEKVPKKTAKRSQSDPQAQRVWSWCKIFSEARITSKIS